MGANWALWAVILFCAWVGFSLWNRHRGMFPPVTPPILLLGVELFGTRAVWLLTTADPSGLGEDQYSIARRIARVSVVFQLALQIWNVCAFQVPLSPGPYLAQVIGRSCVGVIGWIGFVARMQYISKLAARIPDQRTTTRARNLRYSFGIPMGLDTLIRSSEALASAFGIRALRTSVPLEAILGVAALCIMIFGIPYLLMLTRLGDQLRLQHAPAERSWDAALPNDNPSAPV